MHQFRQNHYCPFQSRGGDNGCLTPLSQRQDEQPKGIEPRGTILVGQWDSLLHLFDIGRRVEVVSIVKLPTQVLGQKLANSGFACTGNTHQYDYFLRDQIILCG